MCLTRRFRSWRSGDCSCSSVTYAQENRSRSSVGRPLHREPGPQPPPRGRGGAGHRQKSEIILDRSSQDPPSSLREPASAHADSRRTRLSRGCYHRTYPGNVQSTRSSSSIKVSPDGRHSLGLNTHAATSAPISIPWLASPASNQEVAYVVSSQQSAVSSQQSAVSTDSDGSFSIKSAGPSRWPFFHRFPPRILHLGHRQVVFSTLEVGASHIRPGQVSAVERGPG